VETTTKGLSEAQDNRNSPMELSNSFPWTKVFAEDTSASIPRGMPFRLKSGWILCQFGCSIALCHKFFFGHHLPKESVLPIAPAIFFGKYEQQYGIDHQNGNQDIPAQFGH